MDLLIFISTGALSLLILGVALGLIGMSDSVANARLARYARLIPATRGGARKAQFVDMLTRVGRTAGRGSLESKDRAAIRAKLVQGGFYAPHAVEIFFAIRVLAAFALGMAAMLVVFLVQPPGSLSLFLILLGAAAGLFLPNLLLRQRIKDRGQQIRFGLPDAVDLMVVCLEAGGTLSSAMQRVESEFRDLHPIICEQLGIAMAEIQAGASRAEALTRLADRAGSEEVSSLVTMLIQSEALGASVAQTMRVFADQTRQQRYLDAERRAAELPVKLSIPLVLFIFPALMTVIMTPLVIRIFRQMLSVG